MRFLRVVVALVFGLAVGGPETHACPVHSPAPASHHQNGGHQKAAHCTCPQTCCPSGVTVLLPSYTATWAAPRPPLVATDAPEPRTLVILQRKHLLPFALAPPRA